MIRTLLWKEYREHRLIWLTMTVVNCGALIGLSELQRMSLLPESGSSLMLLGPISVLLVWGYGMICGAMLLAGEREEGTLSFLDTLPVSRLRLWWAKAQIGLLLLIGQMVVLCGFLAVLCTTEGVFQGTDLSPPLWFYALGMLIWGLVGMAYGLFFSARGENVLHTIGWAIIGQILAWIIAGLLSITLALLVLSLVKGLAIEQNPSVKPILGPIIEGPSILFAVFFGLTLAAALGSAHIFSRADRERRPVAVRRIGARASLRASWLRVLWLCYRQMGRLALGVLTFSLFLGLLLLLIGPLLWPIATLGLGVLCGVTVFSDEQTLGSFRFLGDQRLPLGRIWAIKTGMHFLLLLFASFLILLPSLLVSLYYGMVYREEPPLIHEMPFLALIAEVAPWPTFLLIWPLHGFCAGQLCGLLSRKSIVAAIIALMISALLVTLWLPSLAGIGLHFWQVAGPPLILLAAAAFLMRAWAADRLVSKKTYLGVSTAIAASLGWIAFGIRYRVTEVPNVPEPFDVVAYKASLPTADENQAGQLIRSFRGKIEPLMKELHQPRGKKQSLLHECNLVLSNGWPDGPSELGEWMDNVFTENWLQPLVPLPELPLGILADPHLLTLRDLERGDFDKWNDAGSLSSLLAARGLQQQARGDPAVFVEHMRIALALSRNLRHHSPTHRVTFSAGRSAAMVWPTAVDQWLKKLRGRPDLLRRALQTLIDHETKLPDEEEPFRATYLVARNTLLQAPEQLLDFPHRQNKSRSPYEAEQQTLVTLWLFPWEQERHIRLLHLAFRSNDRDIGKIFDWGGRIFESLRFFTIDQRQRQRDRLRELTALRACQLKIALRLYQEEHGDLPGDLDALVPRYFTSLPRDPFNQQWPFGYRLSQGEWIAWLRSPLPAQPPDRADAPESEVPWMPRADGPAALLHPEAMPAAGQAMEREDVQLERALPPQEGIPFMPHADGLPSRLTGTVRLNGRLWSVQFVPPGQGILWSVGEDRHDDGGKEQGLEVGQDLIYLVPPPP